jgi:elongation factor 1-beta
MSDFNTVATIRVMPEGVETDLEALKAKIQDAVPDNMKIHKIEEEPIAFGLVALNVMILTSDKEGGDLDPAKEAFETLDHVSEIDITDVRRLL